MRRLAKVLGVLVSAVMLLSLATTALADDDSHSGDRGHRGNAVVFGAVLTGDREVPPTSTTGYGAASLVLNMTGDTLFYSVEATGLTSTAAAAHIHIGRPGEAGPVVANLCGAGSTPACNTEGIVATGSITSASLVGPLAGKSLGDLLDQIRAGDAYVNVHTTNNPGGEIRGQLVGTGIRHHQDDNDDQGMVEQHDDDND